MVKALAIAAGIVLVVVARDALLSIALSAVIVLGLDPVVAALERRGWGRGRAALLVLGAIALVVFVIVVWAVKPVWNQIHEFADNLPKYVDEMRHWSVIQNLDENTDAMKKLESAFASAARDLPQAAVSLLGAAGSAVGRFFSLFTLVFLTLFGLMAKPLLIQAVEDLMRPDTASRFEKTFDKVTRTISFALIGNIVISVIAGSIVGLVAWLVDAPSPVVLALIVGLFDLIPQVGSAIAAVIVVTVTLVATGVGPAAILLAVILVYQQVENYMIQPAVMKEAVELSGFATIAVVILGSALLGVVGAILAVPVAASVKIVVRELTGERRARIAAMRQEQSTAAADALSGAG